MWVVIDAEFDSLTPTKCWVVGAKDINSGRYYEFFDGASFSKFLLSCNCIIGHNIIGFDDKALRDCWEVDLPKEKVIDTLVLSRLVFYGRPGGHSIESLGRQMGMSKVFVDVYDDPEQMSLYRERCRYDIEITVKVWEDLKRFVFDKEWREAIRVEHELAYICEEMTRNGFAFNKQEAEKVLAEITEEMFQLQSEMISSVEPVVDTIKDYTIRKKKDGSLDKRSETILRTGAGVYINDDVYRVVTYRDFNPASPKDRINLLNASGWKPFNKTKGHLKAEREKDEEKLEKFREMGWTCDEENLSTLPSDAPAGARKLAEWLTLEGRRSDLVEWLDAYDDNTGRIHGKFNHIGSWTHRMSHSKPNQGNIFSVFHIPKGLQYEDLSPVDQIKFRYDGRLRALWQASPGCFLVGADAEGIQLRVLAHLMGDEDYIKAVSEGNKDDLTDVHNVNLRALELNHLVRDDAKTFIYAWLLGAGLGKVSSILKCSTRIASESVTNFIRRFPGLRRIKEVDVPRDAKRSFFIGLDGRKVVCNSQHLMLAGYLQNGEKVIMAHALVWWVNEAKRLGLEFKLVDFVHDEWQVETPDKETANKIGELMCLSLVAVTSTLRMSCPLAGDYRVGLNWKETH